MSVNPITRRPTEPEFSAQLTPEDLAQFSDADLQAAQEWGARQQRMENFRQTAARIIENVLAATKGRPLVERLLTRGENYRGGSRRDMEVWIEELHRLGALNG